MTISHSDAMAGTERALLGSVLLSNCLWSQTDGLSVEDFCLDSHRRIFAGMAVMFESQRPVDAVTLTEELGRENRLDSCGGPAYIGSLIDDALPENFDEYVRVVRAAGFDRRIDRQVHLLNATCA